MCDGDRIIINWEYSVKMYQLFTFKKFVYPVYNIGKRSLLCQVRERVDLIDKTIYVILFNKNVKSTSWQKYVYFFFYWGTLLDKKEIDANFANLHGYSDVDEEMDLKYLIQGGLYFDESSTRKDGFINLEVYDDNNSTSTTWGWRVVMKTFWHIFLWLQDSQK